MVSQPEDYRWSGYGEASAAVGTPRWLANGWGGRWTRRCSTRAFGHRDFGARTKTPREPGAGSESRIDTPSRHLFHADEMMEESEARRRVLARAQPGSVVWLPIGLAAGQALARDLVAEQDSPPWAESRTEGFAVRSSSAIPGARLRLVCAMALEPGEAMPVAAGARLPAGTDAVLRGKEVERGDGWIAPLAGARPGANLSRCGEELRAGRALLRRGAVLTPPRIGLLASHGMPEVPVHAKPLVQIVTAGDALVEPGILLEPGEVYNSFTPLLATAAEEAGAMCGMVHAPYALEGPDAWGETLARCLDTADIVVLVGSRATALGEGRWRAVLGGLGVATEAWDVRLRPEPPFLFGGSGKGSLLFGLPESPVAAYIGFVLFVVPAIRRILGHRLEAGDGSAGLDLFEATAGEIFENRGETPAYRAAACEGGLLRQGGAGSGGGIFALSQANCLVRLGAGQTAAAGDKLGGVWIHPPFSGSPSPPQAPTGLKRRTARRRRVSS